MKDIVIIGAGGFAREVAWLIEDINKKKQQWNLLGFIDDNIKLQKKEINGYKVIGTIEDYQKMSDEIYSVIAIGNGSIRKEIVNKLKNKKFGVLIHPNILISNTVSIKEGTIICAGNIITVNIAIGKHVILNLASTIGHDVILRDFSTICPGVNLSGNTIVGEESIIGTGAAVIQGVKIDNKSIVGAGSVIIRDIPNNCTVVGNPGKIIK